MVPRIPRFHHPPTVALAGGRRRGNDEGDRNDPDPGEASQGIRGGDGGGRHLATLGLGLLQVVRTISSDEGRVVADPTVGGLGPVVGGFAPLAEDWGFVLTSDTAQVLRHRPGLTPLDLVRSHAFGWEGLTVREVFEDPTLMNELRLHPSLSPIDLIRLEAQGGSNVPVCVAIIVLVLTSVEESRDATVVRVDWGGLALIVSSIGLFTFGVDQGPTGGGRRRRRWDLSDWRSSCSSSSSTSRRGWMTRWSTSRSSGSASSPSWWSRGPSATWRSSWPSSSR